MATSASPSNPRPRGAPPPDAPAGTSRQPANSTTDPVLRNALRYTISAREYALLHRYVLSRSRAIKKRVPTVDTVERIMDGRPDSRAREQELGTVKPDKPRARVRLQGPDRAEDLTVSALQGQSSLPALPAADDYNAKAVRHSIRVFIATGALMKIWDTVSSRLMASKQETTAPGSIRTKVPVYKSPAFRLSLSLSTILLLYRLLFRFLARLRGQLLDQSAAPFRQRNPRTALALTSPYAPAVGASLAGLALGVYPAQQLRVSVAVYAAFRALEFGWNAAEDGGMIWGWEKGANGKAERKRARPSWWGSWMLQPFAFGQLFHALVFDRDCFPMAYGNFMLKHSAAYLPPKPVDFPATLQWPSVYQIVDSLAQMAHLHWPPFISPTLFPHKEDAIPAAVAAIAPLASGAHPLITSLSCATLHPSDPSCSRTFLTFWLRSFPPLTRFFLVLYSALMLPRLGSLYHFPLSTIRGLLGQALRMSAFLTGAFSTAWASICFFQTWFPRGFLPTQRFFLGGFMAGFWGWIQRKHSRGVFLSSARLSVDSLWKVGVKRRWWRAMKGGDVWLFVFAMMLTGVVYEKDAKAVREGNWRKGISWARGEAWKDWAIDADDMDDDDDELAERALKEE